MPIVGYLPDPPDFWYIYTIVCDMGEKDFVVKVGVTTNPRERYIDMLTAIPFKSVMLFAYVGGKRKAYRLESIIHQQFKPRRTRGEWFRFGLSEKDEFHLVFRTLYEPFTQLPLKWERVTTKSLCNYRKQKAELLPKPDNRKGIRELNIYRWGRKR